MTALIPTIVPGGLGATRHWMLRRGKQPFDQYANPKGWNVSAFWISYQEACDILKRNGQGFDGLGFIIAREEGRGEKQILGVDLDCCRDPVSGWASPWAINILRKLNSYTEITPSQTGFHVWIYGKLPEGVDSIFSEGQDIEKVPSEVWDHIHAAKPDAPPKVNSIEVYEDGPRHFTFTGWFLAEFPGELQHRQEEIKQVIQENCASCPEPVQDLSDVWKKMEAACKGQGLPKLDVLDVINTSGWEKTGDQLRGPHPILHSTTGHNLVVNPTKGVWAYMHNGLKKGGDAWTWLACESGMVRWEHAGEGNLRDPEILQKVKEYAVHKGYFTREQLFSVNIPNQAKIDNKIIIDDAPLTEGGNATRLIKLHGDDIRYCHTYKKWLIWDGFRWQIDNNGKIVRLAEGIVNHLYLLAANAETANSRQVLSAFAKSSDKNFHLKNVLEIAKNREGVAIVSNVLDCDEWKLCTPNCSIDLKTLEHHKPKREDLITKRIGCNFDREATCLLWLAFLEKIFRGDKELISYLQRAIGYTLSGSTKEQCYFFLHGSGANGKSVFLAVLRALLGEYAKQASFDTFLVQRDAKVRNDLAALAGARLITASEAEEGARMSMQVIKSWTGADPITARFLFGEDFTFRPVGKIWMAANTKPIISERNFAAWRRVHLIPFLVTIPKPEQDTNLEAKLLMELSGILNWALEGLRDYHRIGLEPPEAVKAATETYRRENDSLEAFISEACQIQKLAVCKNTTLFYAYENFCRDTGLNQISQTKFSLDLKAKENISLRKTMEGRFWYGIDLKDEWKSGPIQTRHTITEDPNNSVNMTGMTGNPLSSSRTASQGGGSKTPSYPSLNAPKIGLPIAYDGFDLTPIQKAKICEESSWILRKEPRRDKDQIGLTLDDIFARCGSIPKEAIRAYLLATGWTSSVIEITGIEIYWAPEKVKKAIGVS